MTNGPGGLGGNPLLGERFPTVYAGEVVGRGVIVVITPPDIVKPSQPNVGLLAVCHTKTR